MGGGGQSKDKVGQGGGAPKIPIFGWTSFMNGPIAAFVNFIPKDKSVCFISHIFRKLKFRKSVDYVFGKLVKKAAFTHFPSFTVCSFPNIS